MWLLLCLTLYQLKDTMNAIDDYNNKSGRGGGPDPAGVYIDNSADQAQYDSYLKSLRKGSNVSDFTQFMFRSNVIFRKQFLSKHTTTMHFHIIKS